MRGCAVNSIAELHRSGGKAFCRRQSGNLPVPHSEHSPTWNIWGIEGCGIVILTSLNFTLHYPIYLSIIHSSPSSPAHPFSTSKSPRITPLRFYALSASDHGARSLDIDQLIHHLSPCSILNPLFLPRPTPSPTSPHVPPRNLPLPCSAPRLPLAHLLPMHPSF